MSTCHKACSWFCILMCFMKFNNVFFLQKFWFSINFLSISCALTFGLIQLLEIFKKNYLSCLHILRIKKRNGFNNISGWEKYVYDPTWWSIFRKSRINGRNIKKMGQSFGSFNPPNLPAYVSVF